MRPQTPHNPPPDDPDDLRTLWRRVVDHGATYDESHFLGLLKDVHPWEYDTLFAGLPSPDAEGFIGRLRRLWTDHARGANGLLEGTDGRVSLYLAPQARHRLPTAALVAQGQAAIDQAVRVLRHIHPDEPDADTLEALEVRAGSPRTDAVDGPPADAWETFNDLLLGCTPDEPWAHCLSEAAYGIAASYPLRAWLLQPFMHLPVDLEPLYVLWRGGAQLNVAGGVVWVVVDPPA